MKHSSRWFTFVLVFALASCVSLTINVYFPTKEIEKAADQIEERVRTGQGTEGLDPSSFNTLDNVPRARFALSLGGLEASAQDALNLDIKTPLILKIIESRTERYKKEIETPMNSGVLGEGWNGYLALRDKTGLDLKALTQFKKLIDNENQDRKALYEEILRANKVELTKENMAKVESLFALAIRGKMKEGQWFEVKIDEKKFEWQQKVKEEK